jgi:hypothetical protein
LITCRTAVLAASLVLADEALAQTPVGNPPRMLRISQEPIHGGWGIFLEQDSVLLPGTDKDYTMGVQFSWSGWWVRRNAALRTMLGAPLRALNRLTRMSRWHDGFCAERQDDDLTAPPDCTGSTTETPVQAHTFLFGTSAFTPRKGDPAKEGPDCLAYGCVLHSTETVFNDRPYASLIFATLRRSTARGRSAIASDFTVGVLGLQIAKVVQTAIHQNPLEDPGGWHHQISNSFEPTVNYRVGYKRLIAARTREPRRDWATANPTLRADDTFADLTLDANASAGLYTYGSLGLRTRIGWIDSPYWTADRQTIEFAKDARREDDAPERWFEEAFFFASIGESVWAHNSLLRGQFRDSDTTLKFNPKPSDPNAASPLNRGIWEYQFGALVRFRGWRISYQYARHQALFEGPHSREHAYWSIQVAR